MKRNMAIVSTKQPSCAALFLTVLFAGLCSPTLAQVTCLPNSTYTPPGQAGPVEIPAFSYAIRDSTFTGPVFDVSAMRVAVGLVAVGLVAGGHADGSNALGWRWHAAFSCSLGGSVLPPAATDYVPNLQPVNPATGLQFPRSALRGVNDHAQLVGYSDFIVNTPQLRATRFDVATHTLMNLGTLPGDFQSTAYDINNSGLIVGASVLSSQGASRAFRRTPAGNNRLSTAGTMVELMGVKPLIHENEAYAMNESGTVVGQSAGGSGATNWNPNSTVGIDLGTLPGALSSFATSLNNNGRVAGYRTLPFNPITRISPITAAYHDKGVWTNPGIPAGWDQSYATGINDNDIVVGYVLRNSSEINAGYWLPDGTFVNLSVLIPFYLRTYVEIHAAVPINNANVIVGTGRLDRDGPGTEFGLVPTAFTYVVPLHPRTDHARDAGGLGACCWSAKAPGEPQRLCHPRDGTSALGALGRPQAGRHRRSMRKTDRCVWSSRCIATSRSTRCWPSSRRSRPRRPQEPGSSTHSSARTGPGRTGG